MYYLIAIKVAHCQQIISEHSQCKAKNKTSALYSAGLEPARGDPNGFQVLRLNNSATTTTVMFITTFSRNLTPDALLERVSPKLVVKRATSPFVYFPIRFNLCHTQPPLFLFAPESPLWCFSSLTYHYFQVLQHFNRNLGRQRTTQNIVK